jgi:hypothetical protein
LSQKIYAFVKRKIEVAMSELVDYLDEFVASLEGGEEATGSGVFGGEMPAFLHLITLLHKALTPIQPKPSYTTTLKQTLLGQTPLNQPVPTVETPPSRRRLWVGAAAIGSILSVTGVTLFFVRRFRAVTPQTHPIS